MKHLPAIAGALLGLAFVVFGLENFLHFLPPPDPPPTFAPEAMNFMGAMGLTGYMDFVKVLEVAGGLFVALPRTRNIGLLILGPIIINILAFHLFLNKGATLVHPVTIAISVLAVFLLWSERKAWAVLIRRNPA